MTEAQQTEEMKRYLFHEMSAEESDALEERYFEDAGFFYDLLELENDLIDRYAVGNLQGEDLVRFGKSLEKSPERLEKISDARVLQKLIAEEKSKSAIAIAAPTFWEKLGSFFKISTSGLKLVAGALAVLLVCTAAFLFIRNWQHNQYADIEKRKQMQIELQEKENQQKKDSEELKKLEEILKNETNVTIENSNSNAEQNPIRQQIEDKKKQMEKRQKQLEQDRKKLNLPFEQKEVKPLDEILASWFPETDNGVSVNAKPVNNSNEEQVRIVIKLPKNNKYTWIAIVSGGQILDSDEISEGTEVAFLEIPKNATEGYIWAEEDSVRGSGSGKKRLGKYKLEKKTK